MRGKFFGLNIVIFTFSMVVFFLIYSFKQDKKQALSAAMGVFIIFFSITLVWFLKTSLGH